MAFPANYPFECLNLTSGEGHNHEARTLSVFLVGIAGPSGLPTPATQLSVKRDERFSGNVTTVTETASRGRGRGTRVIATRTYSHPRFARSPEREAIRLAARWLSPTGSDVAVWCRMVSCECAQAAGFRVSAYVKTAQAGTRTVGRENMVSAAPILNRAAGSLPVSLEAPTVSPENVGQAIATAERTGVATFNPYRDLTPQAAPVAPTPTQGVRTVDLDESVPSKAPIDVSHITERFKRLDLD